MKHIFTAFACGVLFAIGLVVAGMTQPAKVIGFLDLSGAWDPSLAFVMVGAIGVYLPLYFLIRRRERPLLGDHFAVPTEKAIDARLIGGAAIFGVGWGASGYCPGPAVVSLLSGAAAPLIFVVGVCAGLAAFELVRALLGGGARDDVAPQSTTTLGP